MKTKIFPFIIAISALAVSISAASYSVYGLSKLFAGASTAVIIMASSLEFAKLIVASALYQYWNSISKLLKLYLFMALIVLVTITSGGIYGFLSGAYQETSNQAFVVDAKLELLNTKRNRHLERLSDIDFSIKNYAKALSNPKNIQYVDSETGQLVTTTSSRQRAMMDKKLSLAKEEYASISDSIYFYDSKILNVSLLNETTNELGPLKYMAGLLNKSMDTIINWFMLLIIFVFDPLALVLVVLANIAFTKKQDPKSLGYFNTRNKLLKQLVESKDKEKHIEKIVEYRNNPIVLETLLQLIHRNPEFSAEFEEKLKNQFYGKENK